MKIARDLLIIDDEEVVRRSAVRIGQGEGLSADVAEDVAGGLDLLDGSAYRLVLSDLMMEGQDGFSLLAEMERRGCRIPVIMMTGYSTLENAVRSLQCGAIDFLAKPFTADEFLAVLRRGMAFSRLLEAASSGGPALETNPPPPDRRRLGHISWAVAEPEGTVKAGINGLFLRTVGGISGITLFPPGQELVQGSSCATIHGADGLAHEVMCPVSGRVVESNTVLAGDPGLLESNPYTGGWLYRVVPSDLAYSFKWLK